VRWRTPIKQGYAGPAVAGGRVFVTDRQVTSGVDTPGDPFARGQIPGQERVLCLDERDGRILWEHSYDRAYTVSYPAGPRTTPLVAHGKVYTLGAEGDLFCLNADSGDVVWSKSFGRDYDAKTPMWGFAAHPLLDGDRLVCLVGGKDSLVVAFDKDTGTEIWRALNTKEPGYCPPVIYEFAGHRQLIVFHPEGIHGLDPATGKLHWTFPVEIRAGLTVPMPRQDDERLFLTTFYNGSLMLDLSSREPQELWRSPKPSEKDTYALHSIMPTPHIVEDYIYGVCSYGQLRCIEKTDGKRIWETFQATTGKPQRWGNAFLVRQAERFWLFNEQGDLIVARLTPESYEEIDRIHLLDATNEDPRRPVVWSHPAFANRCVYARNDREIVCVSLAAQ
jgi:outer membrane protein assembly factor BamB